MGRGIESSFRSLLSLLFSPLYVDLQLFLSITIQMDHLATENSGAGKVEESIRMGGLAEIKTARIKAILATLLEERGKICMEYLREMSDDEIKAELSR